MTSSRTKTLYFAILASFFLNIGCNDPHDARITSTNPSVQAGTKCVDLDEKICKLRTDCQWDANSCVDIVRKTFTVYEFGTMLKDDIQANYGLLHTVVSSTQGMVYVLGEVKGRGGNPIADNFTTVIDRTEDGATWKKTDLGLPAIGDSHTPITASLHYGVVVYLPGHLSTITFLDTLGTPNKVWTNAQAGFAPQVPTALFEVKKAPNKFYLYASLNSADNGLLYFDSITNAWVGGYTRADGSPLSHPYTSLAEGPNSLLLASQDSDEIYEIDKSDVGINHSSNKKLKSNDPSVRQVELQHISGTSNGAITSMLLVDNKYLLVGFNGANIHSAGWLFYRDISAGLPLKNSPPTKWEKSIDAGNILSMIADRNNPKRAVIATDRGIMIFEDNKIVEIGGSQIMTPAMVSDRSNKANLLDRTLAKTGLAGAYNEVPKRGIAQDKHGRFYFNTDNFISTLEITSKDL